MDNLDEFAPFGPQNSRPVFKASNVKLAGSSYIVGRNHMKFKIRSGGKVFDCIGFGMGDRVAQLNAHQGIIDLAYIPERNEWDGSMRLQLRIKDVQFI